MSASRVTRTPADVVAQYSRPAGGRRTSALVVPNTRLSAHPSDPVELVRRDARTDRLPDAGVHLGDDPPGLPHHGDLVGRLAHQPSFSSRCGPLWGPERDKNGKVLLAQERFTIGFHNASGSLWKIPITYFIDGQSAPATMVMSEKTASLEDISADRALKLNLDGAGNYRVAYDASSWKLLLASLPGMNAPDKVNLLGDAWAFVQAGRQPLAFYTGLVGRLPQDTALCEEAGIKVFADEANARVYAAYEQLLASGKYNRITAKPGEVFAESPGNSD